MTEPRKSDSPALSGDYFSAAALYELAFTVAGATSAIFMMDSPDEVMPAVEIKDEIRRILEDDYSIAAPEGYR